MSHKANGQVKWGTESVPKSSKKNIYSFIQNIKNKT